MPTLGLDGRYVDLPIKIRDSKASDVRKIVRTWQRTHQMFGCAVMPMCAPARNIYMGNHMNVILSLTEPEKCRVCCHMEDDDLIYGWVCYEPKLQVENLPILHYIYTTDGFRHYGVATNLLKEVGMLDPPRIWVTHYNYRIRRLLKKLRQRWWYNPYLAEDIIHGQDTVTN